MRTIDRQAPFLEHFRIIRHHNGALRLLSPPLIHFNNRNKSYRLSFTFPTTCTKCFELHTWIEMDASKMKKMILCFQQQHTITWSRESWTYLSRWWNWPLETTPLVICAWTVSHKAPTCVGDTLFSLGSILSLSLCQFSPALVPSRRCLLQAVTHVVAC